LGISRNRLVVPKTSNTNYSEVEDKHLSLKQARYLAQAHV